MARKVILVTDPGIDGAFAGALALFAPELEVVGLAATAGNVPAEQATRNVHILVEQLDPPRWPRLGAALPVEYDVDARSLHGPNGLGGVDFPCVQLHHAHPADKLLSDLVRMYPKEVAVLLLGPATVFARALDRDPELAGLVERVVMVGGAWREAGDVTAAAEFHVYCDPAAARQVLRSGVPLTLLPLDVTRKAVFSPTELLHLPNPESPASRASSGRSCRTPSPPRPGCTAWRAAICRTCSAWWRWRGRRRSRRGWSRWTWRRAAN